MTILCSKPTNGAHTVLQNGNLWWIEFYTVKSTHTYIHKQVYISKGCIEWAQSNYMLPILSPLN